MAVDKQAAIIGGSVAGGVILFVLFTVIIYIVCSKKRRRRREDKKFQHLSPHHSPTHSQPSSLGHGLSDPRLPKVSSNGLWLGTPSVYAVAPSPAYLYGRPGHKPHVVHTDLMQRAISESRLPQVPGPPFYTTNSNPRIYHSQQLTPVYEIIDPMYDFRVADSRSDLISNHRSSQREGTRGKPFERSNNHNRSSDNPRRSYQSNKKSTDKEQPSSSAYSIQSRERVQVHHETKSRSESFDQEVAFKNKGFVHDSAEKIHKISDDKMITAQSASATDSMKLLAKNRTDDQKTVVHGSSSSSTQYPEKRPIVPKPSNEHEGEDIYAVPHKEGKLPHAQLNGTVPQREDGMLRTESSNPILARMQKMNLDGSDSFEQDPVTDIAETTEPLFITPREETVYRNPIVHNPVYREQEGTRTSEVPNVVFKGSKSGNMLSKTSHISEASVSNLANGPTGADVLETISRSKPSEIKDVYGAFKEVEPKLDALKSEPVDIMKELRHSHLNVETESIPDDSSTRGKDITKAFEFLDNYLSDDDGTVTQSPPKSPTLSGHELDLF